MASAYWASAVRCDVHDFAWALTFDLCGGSHDTLLRSPSRHEKSVLPTENAARSVEDLSCFSVGSVKATQTFCCCCCFEMEFVHVAPAVLECDT